MNKRLIWCPGMQQMPAGARVLGSHSLHVHLFFYAFVCGNQCKCLPSKSTDGKLHVFWYTRSGHLIPFLWHLCGYKLTKSGFSLLVEFWVSCVKYKTRRTANKDPEYMYILDWRAIRLNRTSYILIMTSALIERKQSNINIKKTQLA